MLQNELQRERNRLEERIETLEAELQPRQRELRELRERLGHVKGLLPSEQTTPLGNSQEPLARVKWARICREHGWQVGGDSAHRVVMRENPPLHRSISHWCTYDNRQYP